MPFSEELTVARAAAWEAASEAQRLYARGLDAEEKGDLSPVTIADRAGERIIGSLLSRYFPDDGLLGEEGAQRESKSGRRWIIDPIDGTRDFVRGIPLWAVLIGLEDRGETVAGVVHLPGWKQTYWAARGEGAWRDGSAITASSKTLFSESVLSMNGISHLEGSEMGERLGSSFIADMARFWAVRTLGGSMDACLVGSGCADIWLEPKVAPWDLAAHRVILEESGARFFTLDGSSSIYRGNAIGCAQGLEDEVRKWLKVPRP